MKKRDDAVYLNDILDAIRQVEVYLEGVTYEAFRSDRMRQDAVVRQLEIIGEASRNLSGDFRSRHSEIPWQDIVGMRHKIAHDYFKVDLPTVWDTVMVDLPALRTWIAALLSSSERLSDGT